MLAMTAVTTFAYRLFFFLHILAALVAFAPAFTTPTLLGRYKRANEDASSLAAKISKGSAQIYGPALVLVGVFGFGMIGMSKKTITFSQSWVSASMGLWLVMLGVFFALLMPAERKLAAGDASAQGKVGMFSGIIHVLLLVILVLMVWQPGLR